MKIIFVCTGNTCRSPLAQAFLEDKLKKLGIEGIEVDSCGINCIQGDEISQNSKQVLIDEKIQFDHKSKAITLEDISSTDLIVCMTLSHKKALEKVVDNEKLLCFNDITNDGDIFDPYGQSLVVYKYVAEQIKKGVDILISKYILNK